jgi:hypothetical protein
VTAIDAQHAWNNRVAALTNLPIGTQLGLFPDGTTVASKVDAAAIGEPAPISPAAAINGAYTTEELIDAAWAGEKAATEGKAKNTNPHEFGTPLADRWNVGWDDEHKRLVQIGQWNPAPPEETVQVTGAAGAEITG